MNLLEKFKTEKRKTLKEELHDEWEKELAALAEMDIQDDIYDVQAKRVSNLEDRLVDLEKTDIENKSGQRKNWIQVGGDILKLGGSLSVAFLISTISMKWDDDHVQTHEAGRISLRGIDKIQIITCRKGLLWAASLFFRKIFVHLYEKGWDNLC